jgi:hypothetical protein
MYATYDDCLAAEQNDMIIVEGIRQAQRLANCSHLHASTTWYALNTTLISTLSAHLQAARGWSVRKANAAARKVVHESHNNGESIAYSLDLLDNGTI